MSIPLTRTSIINALACKIKAKSYLEIGVSDGENFSRILVERRVGVDPFRVEGPDARLVVKLSSDDFFASNTETFDLIFVDGLHHSDQVDRDLDNSLKVLNPGGWIVCHDMSPPTKLMQEVPYPGCGAWNGDCWKSWMRLRTERSGLFLAVVDTDSGVGLISRNTDSCTSIRVHEEWTFENLEKNRVKWLNLISIDDFFQHILYDDLDAKLYSFVGDPSNPESNFDLGLHYDKLEQTASAISYYIRTAERATDPLLQYEALIRAAACFERQGTRGLSVRGLLQRAISLLPHRPEAHFLLARFHERSKDVECWVNCFTISTMALELCDFEGGDRPLRTNVDYPGRYGLLFEKAVSAWWVGLCVESAALFKDLLINHKMDALHHQSVLNNLKFMNQFVTKEILQYDRAKFDRLRFKFVAAETIERNYSESYQDMFVLSMLNGKRGGGYIEIGAGKPIYGNNTYLLEKDFGWKGISIDNNSDFVSEWAAKRKNLCICTDALGVDYYALILSAALPSTVPSQLDYLQIDIDPASNSLAVLKKIPFDKIRFAVITFEHDRYAEVDPTVRDESRKLLKSHGYVVVAPNISPDDWRPYEDWWVHPTAIDPNILRKMQVAGDDTKVAEKYMLR